MIGIFDSGSGGLTVLKAIRSEMPSADIVYFGDIKNAPYGSKTNSELSDLTVRAIELLRAHGAESIVSACNSVSASLAVSLFDALSLAPERLIEMVGPTVSAFKGSGARILLVATPATIESGIYQNAFRMIGKDIDALPIPDLAAAIEFGRSEAEIEAIVRKALGGADMSAYDTLILACTHYPLVQLVFERIAASLTVVDPAWAVARRAKRQLWPREVGEGTLRFLISQESSTFRGRVANLFGESGYTIEVIP